VNGLEKEHLLGEWDNKLNCFWFGANHCEFIAWKGSHQVFIYPCDEYPQAPSQIIQHSDRIETLDDFSAAIQKGIVYDSTYKEAKPDWRKLSVQEDILL
jgi:hypothetical protein